MDIILVTHLVQHLPDLVSHSTVDVKLMFNI
jgi:hypothetical protein